MRVAPRVSKGTKLPLRRGSGRHSGYLDGSGRFLVRQFEGLRHGATARGRIKLKEDLLKTLGIEAAADTGNTGRRLASATTAVEAESRTGFRPILHRQRVHEFS